MALNKSMAQVQTLEGFKPPAVHVTADATHIVLHDFLTA